MVKKFLFLIIMLSIQQFSFGKPDSKALVISRLTDNFYVYTTYTLLNGSPYPSNSMFLVTDSGVVMFDTPWDTTQFQPLVDSIDHRWHKKIVLCVATHFHADRTAGLDFLTNKGIKTYSSKLTYDLCKQHKEPQAQYYFLHDTTFTVGGYAFKTFYPGEGHSSDNIVVWFGAYRILYGGCLVKSEENTSIGNLSDANIKEWPLTIKKLMKEFPNPEYVIPGHMSWTGKGQLPHTLKLIHAYKKAK